MAKQWAAVARGREAVGSSSNKRVGMLSLSWVIMMMRMMMRMIITHLRLEQYFWIYDVLVKTMTARQSKDYLSKSRLLVRGHFVRGKATCQWLLVQVMAAVNDCLSVAVNDCLSTAVNCCQ